MYRFSVLKYDNAQVPLQFRNEHPCPNPAILLSFLANRLRQRAFAPFTSKVWPFPENLLFEVPRRLQLILNLTAPEQ